MHIFVYLYTTSVPFKQVVVVIMIQLFPLDEMCKESAKQNVLRVKQKALLRCHKGSNVEKWQKTDGQKNYL